MTALSGPAAALTPNVDGELYCEPTSKRIRAVLGGEVIVDSTNAALVWEHRYYPQYYVPKVDVAEDALIPSETVAERKPMGTTQWFTVKAGGREVVDGAWQHPEARPESLRSMVRFDWSTADAWFEEDVEVFVHPRSPYVRVDVLDSDRHVRIEIDGVTVANTHRAKLLFETGLPTRYYVPQLDVRLDLLTPTDSATSCPYKGTARYWTATINAQTHTDIVWGYDTPLAESVGVTGRMCFYNEKVDLFIDGEPES